MHLRLCKRLGRGCLNAAQVLLSQLLVHNLQRLVIQARHARLVARRAVARLAHASVVQVDCSNPQPWRAEVRPAIPCRKVTLTTIGLNVIVNELYLLVTSRATASLALVRIKIDGHDSSHGRLMFDKPQPINNFV